MLFSCCLPVINMFLSVYYMFLTEKNDAAAPFITYEVNFVGLMGLQYKLQ